MMLFKVIITPAHVVGACAGVIHWAAFVFNAGEHEPSSRVFVSYQ